MPLWCVDSHTLIEAPTAEDADASVREGLERIDGHMETIDVDIHAAAAASLDERLERITGKW